MIIEGLNHLWPTPVLKTKFETPSGVIEHLLTEYGDANKKSANVSGDNLFDDLELVEFRQNIVVPVFKQYCNPYFDLDKKDYDLRAWLTGYGTGYAMPKHNHSGSHLSAVFYLLVDKKGGELILHDPRTNANRGYKDEFNNMFEMERFNPETNDVIMFPSFLYHNVETYTGSLRLAMPVDLILY